jgi:hypothetical protein
LHLKNNESIILKKNYIKQKHNKIAELIIPEVFDGRVACYVCLSFSETTISIHVLTREYLRILLP